MQSQLTALIGDNGVMTLGDAIRTARKAKKLTLEQVGSHFGISKSAVGQWESGKNLPDPRKQRELVRFLGLDPSVVLGLAEENNPQGNAKDVVSKSSYLSKTDAITLASDIPSLHRDQMPKDVPVLGTVLGGIAGGDFTMNGLPVEFVRRPPRLFGRRDVFAVYVQGVSMSPRYLPGELIFLETNRPARSGDHVVVELRPAQDGGDWEAYLKLLAGITPTKVKLQQYSPSASIEIDRRKVSRIVRVMTTMDLLGV